VTVVPSRRRLLRLHVGLVLATCICISGFVIELWRALDGNALSWAYVVVWPALFCYGVYMWRRLVREERGEALRAARFPANRAEDDEALTKWNAYLAALHESESKHVDDAR
jgi:hypothetical protein